MLLRALFCWILLLGSFLEWGCTAAPEPAASPLTTIPDPKTLGETYVSNPDSILSGATVQELNATLQALDQAGRAHLDVVAVRSIGTDVPKELATGLFNRWKIGDARQSNGLLLLLVLDQRRVEFETGYGLEADLPDILCFRIQQRYMVPYLRQNRYDEAVRQGVAAIIRQLTTGSLTPPDSAATSFSLAPDPEEAFRPAEESAYLSPPDPSGWSDTELVLVWVGGALLAVLAVVLGLQTTALRGGWVLLAGGALVFGGLAVAAPISAAGLLGLGYGGLWACAHLYFGWVHRQLRRVYGASSRHVRHQFLAQAHHHLGYTAYLFPLVLAWYWPRFRRRLQALRDEPYPCPQCQAPMHRLSEQADDEHLQPGQAAEERIQSIDYDVWECAPCQHRLVLDYRNLSTSARACSQCHYLTDEPKPDQVVQRATTSASGWGWKVHRCAFCGHETKEKYTIAQLADSSSSGSSFSSSSSSSSSSSWSSSSGGSSGGGGAGSSW